jgi:hypothetical protein
MENRSCKKCTTKASEKIQDKIPVKKILVFLDISEGEREEITYTELNDNNA